MGCQTMLSYCNAARYASITPLNRRVVVHRRRTIYNVVCRRRLETFTGDHHQSGFRMIRQVELEDECTVSAPSRPPPPEGGKTNIRKMPQFVHTTLGKFIWIVLRPLGQFPQSAFKHVPQDDTASAKLNRAKRKKPRGGSERSQRTLLGLPPPPDTRKNRYNGKTAAGSRFCSTTLRPPA